MSGLLDRNKTLLETANAINSVLYLSCRDQELLLHVIEDYFDPCGPDYHEENSTGMCVCIFR